MAHFSVFLCWYSQCDLSTTAGPVRAWGEADTEVRLRPALLSHVKRGLAQYKYPKLANLLYVEK